MINIYSENNISLCF